METEVKKRGPGRPPKAEKAMLVEAVGGNPNIQVVDNVDSLADNTKKQLAGSEDLGTTSTRLFPDYGEKNTSDREAEPKESGDLFSPQGEAVEQTPVQEEQKEEVLDIDTLKGKKFKAVIGGQEQVVPVEEIVKGYQTDQYLSQKGNKLYEERKALAEERQRLEQLKQSRPNQDLYQEPAPYQDDDYIRRLENRIARMEQNVEFIAQGSKPAIYESNQKRLAEELKREGFDDFMEYIPKMKQYIANLQDDRMVMFYDTYEGGKALYQQLKNKELMERLKANEASKPVQTVQKPPIVRINAGSSQGTPIDTNNVRIKEAFNRARQTRDPDDWNEYLRLIGQI